jgi:hypothetical protein
MPTAKSTRAWRLLTRKRIAFIAGSAVGLLVVAAISFVLSPFGIGRDAERSGRGEHGESGHAGTVQQDKVATPLVRYATPEEAIIAFRSAFVKRDYATMRNVCAPTMQDGILHQALFTATGSDLEAIGGILRRHGVAPARVSIASISHKKALAELSQSVADKFLFYTDVCDCVSHAENGRVLDSPFLAGRVRQAAVEGDRAISAQYRLVKVDGGWRVHSLTVTPEELVAHWPLESKLQRWIGSMPPPPVNTGLPEVPEQLVVGRWRSSPSYRKSMYTLIIAANGKASVEDGRLSMAGTWKVSAVDPDKLTINLTLNMTATEPGVDVRGCLFPSGRPIEIKATIQYCDRMSLRVGRMNTLGEIVHHRQR